MGERKLFSLVRKSTQDLGARVGGLEGERRQAHQDWLAGDNLAIDLSEKTKGSMSGLGGGHIPMQFISCDDV